MRKSLKLLFISIIFAGSFLVVKTAYGATEFVSIIDPGNGAGTDYTTLNGWENAVQVDLTAATTLVFSYTPATASGTIPDNVTVQGQLSGATATLIHQTATTTSAQVLLKSISGGPFQSGEQVYLQSTGASSTYVVLSNAGDSPIAVASCRSTNGTADVTAVTIDGWTTATSTYIKIWTDPTTGARHNGKWDDGKYRIEPATNNTVINISDNNIRIDGLQLKLTNTIGDFNGIYVTTQTGGSEIVISNSIVRAEISNIGQGSAITFHDGAAVAKVFNNIIYGARNDSQSTGTGLGICTSNPGYIYNNTFYNNRIAISNGCYGGVPKYAKNNITQFSSSDGFYNSDPWGAGSDYNISDIAGDTTGGAHDKGTTTVSFVDSANKDFHLSPTDTAARNAGTSTIPWDANLNFTQDIDGSYRGAAWDIGADEVPTEFVSTICESTSAGGDCANRSYSTLSAWEAAVDSNLTASGTRVFSGTASGTVSASAVTLYDAGDASTGITGTIGATTSNQILIVNIVGTSTPVSVASGSSWRITSANTWRIAGTADQLGASPIATAKIDGSWAGADTAGVEITDWTTSADNYIKIYTTSSAQHNGKWDAGRYRMEPNNNRAILNREDFVRIIGLQFTRSGYTAVDMRPEGSASIIYFSQNILRATSTTDYTEGLDLMSAVASSSAFVYDNIFYNMTGAESAALRVLADSFTAYVYNNTFYGSTRGISKSASSIVVAKNNISYNNTENYNGNNFSASSINNLSGPTQTDAPGSNPQNAKTVNFISVSNVDFHLADSDTNAKGQGTNLYTDANINVTNDIDSAGRSATSTTGIAWDIGADQTAVKIYYSVGQNNTVDYKTGTPTMDIANGTATFSAAQTATNIGVGDRVTYNTSSIAYISQKITTSQWKLITATGTVPTNVTGATVDSIKHEFSSLTMAIGNGSNWAGNSSHLNSSDLVAGNYQLNIPLYYDTGAHDSGLTMSTNYVAAPQNYIKMYTPNNTVSEVNASQRHSGKWDNTKFRIDVNSSFNLNISYTVLEGLQLDIGSGGVTIYGGTRAVKVYNNIIKSSYSSAYGIQIEGAGTTAAEVAYIYNNIVYGGARRIARYYDGGNKKAYVFNNTVYGGSTAGINDMAGSTVVAKNNIVQGAVDGYLGTFASGSDYNLSDLASDAPSSGYRNNLATVVSFFDLTGTDYHLSPTDTMALDQGTSTAADANLAVTDDIDGHLRRTPDIGADEASVEYVTSVMESGGNFSTLSSWEAANQVDLAATTTAVFSLSSASGTIPASASIMGLTSGAVASTTVGSVSTSTQILLYNIASSTFQSGERIYIKGSATTSNYAILSNAGNPAIATAKIDGAWTNPDTTAVTIDGWTTGPNNYIRVYTASTARHNGKWDDGKYRLYANNLSILILADNFISVDGLQIDGSDMAYDSALSSGIEDDSGKHTISNNIIRGDLSNPDMNNSGFVIGNGSEGGVVYFYNNLIYGFKGPGNYCVAQNDGAGVRTDFYAYNNTVYHCTIGYNENIAGLYFKSVNNISQDSATDFSGTFDNSSYNLSADNTAPGTNSKTLTIVSFVDSANKDFHLSPSDTAARNAGTSTILWDTNLSFTQDIDGSYRGAAWDIGADEVPTEYVSTICESTSAGGSCTNRDYSTLSNWEWDVRANLNASSTRVFSGSRTGSFADGATLTLYRSGVTTGITAAVVATTSSQILLRDISAGINYSSSTIATSTLLPLYAQNGDQWRLDASNYWTASGTADQLGASPIATAKIDGAWASADTANLLLDDNNWTTSYDNYIKIYTTAIARHDGKWNTNRYRLETTSRAIDNLESYVKIDGLQIKRTASNTSWESVVWLRGSGENTLSNSIVRSAFTGTSANDYGIYATGATTNFYIFNNIVYDLVNGANVMTGINADVKSYIYNNTVYNSYRAIGGGTGRLAKNNIAQNCSSGDCYTGTFSSASDNNISDIVGDAPNATFATTSKVVSFVSTSTPDFHLTDSDTIAKGQGANLYADANINVTNDIDSAGRPSTNSGLAWDIGADQTAVKIYRSIAPSDSSVLASGGANAMSISSSTSLATFATALADNIGVGDIIIYNAGGTATATAFIHGRSSSTVYTVKTASGTAPTAVTADTSWSIYRAYTTLANAEAGDENSGIANTAIRNFDTWSGGADLVASNTQWNIAAYANGSNADTAVVTIDGWTTGAQNYLKVYTPTAVSEVGTSQRHQGKWDDAKYRLEVSIGAGGGSGIVMWDDNVRIDGLQIKLSVTQNVYSQAIQTNGNNSGSEIYISNNIIKAGARDASALQFTGINYGQIDYIEKVYIYNNIIYGGFDIGIYRDGINRYWYVYNNTIYGNLNGIVAGSYNRVYAKNNIAYNNSTTDYGDTYDSSSTNNLSKDSSAPAYGTYYRNATVSFVDPISSDLHLAPSDTAALDQGTSTAADANLAVTDDIDGHLRRTPDIGADEASVEYVTSVMESGGNFSTLSSWEAANQVDLATTSTAVFSLSSASGTIPASASIMGLTSGAVASTTVGSVSTSTQILLYNIASSTFLTGERIYIKGGATTSNYVIISNAGNPAIATAKIDGAWTGADSPQLYVDGWTTGRNNYIRIYTTAAARHNGKWDDTKYRIENNSMNKIYEDFVWIDGIQFNFIRNSESWNYALEFRGDNGAEAKLSKSIIKGTYTGNSTNDIGVIFAWHASGARTAKVSNNIIYNIINGAYTHEALYIGGTWTGYVYNNTLYNNNIGLLASGVTIAKNNIAYTNTDNYNGSFSSSFNNLSSSSDAPGSDSVNNATVQFVDETNRDFHLSPSDTAARDAGVDLSADANLAITTDIDGQARGAEATSTAGGLAWDIGADEGPSIIYRSAGNDTNNLNTGGATVIITNATSSSLATFSSTLANNIGVGDVIQYGSPLTLAFITGRSSSTVYSVQSATSSYPIATTSAAAAIYRTHTLLNNWQTQTTATVNQGISTGLRSQVLVARNLVASNTAMFVAAYASSSPDNTAVSIGTWTTGAGNYIKVYTPVNSSEVGTSQRHAGKWDETKYRLVISDNYRPILNYVNYIWFDGLQISNDTAVDYGVGILHRPNGRSTSTDIKISNNIIRTTVSPTWFVSGLDLSYGATYKVWNNILYDFSNVSGNGRAIFIWNDPTNGLSVTYLYNNTIYNSYYGIWNAGSGTTTAINNIVVGSGNTNAYAGTFATGTDYNATDGTDNIGQGTHNKISQTFNFINLANRDFHLAPTDRGARDSGASLAADQFLPFATDIDGNTRPYGSAWDIGADEDAVANPDYRFNGWFKLKGFFKFQ